jgi:hypothetical protein
LRRLSWPEAWGNLLSGYQTECGDRDETIQFLAIVFILPLYHLGLMNALGRDTIGTLLGVVVGYVLSGFGKEQTG